MIVPHFSLAVLCNVRSMELISVFLSVVTSTFDKNVLLSRLTSLYADLKPSVFKRREGSIS